MIEVAIREVGDVHGLLHKVVEEVAEDKVRR